MLDVLPEAARRYLEELMATGTYEYRSEFARRYYGQGRTEGLSEGLSEGLARAVLRVLEARGLAVPDDVRSRVSTTRDAELLTRWLERAATATSVDEVLG